MLKDIHTYGHPIAKLFLNTITFCGRGH